MHIIMKYTLVVCIIRVDNSYIGSLYKRYIYTIIHKKRIFEGMRKREITVGDYYLSQSVYKILAEMSIKGDCC